MAVIGELVQAQVGLHDERLTDLGGRDTGGDVEDSVGVVGSRADRVLVLGNAEQHHAAHARLVRRRSAPA